MTNKKPDDFEIIPMGESLYDFQELKYNPIKDAPIYEECGGILFFPNNIQKKDFLALCRIWDIFDRNNDYSIFRCKSENASKDKFLEQLRIVHKFGLRFFYQSISEQEYDSFEEQLISIPECLWEFIQEQNLIWGTSMGNDNINRVFGGDDYWELEKLCYGFIIENSYYNIYRIWSRCWLVTK